MEKYSRAFDEIRRICARFCDFGTIRRISCDFITTPNFTKIFIWGIALHLIALFALFRADFYYNDDLKTSVMDISWDHNSRYFATFVLNTLSSLGKGAIDASPLLQILGVVFVVLSAMILLYLIRRKFDLLGIIASLPLGLSPHFLQNLSYKFESLFMCIALFLAVLPFLFKENKRVFCVVSVLCLLLMFMSYQAANASYIILSLYFALFMSADFKQRAGFLGICALNLIIASALYKLTITPIPSNTYATDAIIPLSAFFTGIAHNLAQYFTTIFSDFKQTPYIWLIALNCVLFVLNAIFCKNRRIYAILFLAFGFCASYGLYLVLQSPLWEPRAFYGLNALIAVICITNASCSNVSQFAESNVFCHSERSEESQNNNRDSSVALLPQNDKFLFKILRFLSIATILIVAYFLISFANAYGNALKKQDEYLSFRAEMLLQYLGEKVPRGATINLKNHLGFHPVSARFLAKYGETRLVKDVKEYYYHFYSRLQHLNAPYNLNESDICDFVRENFGAEAVAENAWHKIEKAKVCYIVTIK